MFDRLVVTYDVLVAEPSEWGFGVSASAVYAKGQRFSEPLPARVEGKSPGTYPVKFVLPADRITRHGVDGPWTLKDVTLWDKEAGFAIDRQPDYVTQAYPVASFGPPPPPSIDTIIARKGAAEWVVHGEGLKDVTKVLVDGLDVPFTIRADNELALQIPDGAVERQGRDVLIVTGPHERRYAEGRVTVITPWGKTEHLCSWCW